MNFNDRVREVVDPLILQLESLHLSSEGEGAQAPDTRFVRLIQDIKTEVASTEKIVKEISAQIQSSKDEEKSVTEKIKEKGIKLFEPRSDDRSTIDRLLDAMKEYFKEGQEAYDSLDNMIDVFKEYFKYKFRNKAWDIENILRLLQLIIPFMAAAKAVDNIKPFVEATNKSVQRMESDQKKSEKSRKEEHAEELEKLSELEEELIACCEQQADTAQRLEEKFSPLLSSPTQSLEMLSRLRSVQSQLAELRGLL